MAKALALMAAAAAVGLALGLLIPRAAFSQGGGEWVKFLFTPQAGVNSACLSCGWHSGACGPTSGPALDFGGLCTDTQLVYFRNFGFKASGSPQLVAYGVPVAVPDATCKTVYVNIYDFQSNLLGRMYYTHTYMIGGGSVMMFASQSGSPNEGVVAGMAKKPWDDGGIPDSQKENQACWDQHLTEGIHLHEYGVDGASTFLLRDGGSCTGVIKYPCGPQSLPYPTYDPQDWSNDWARGLCVSTTDSDCDDFTNAVEQYLGTDPYDNCPDNSSDDAWPLDMDMNRLINLGGDVGKYVGKMGCVVATNPGCRRLDLNADGFINLGGDVLLYRGTIGETCT